MEDCLLDNPYNLRGRINYLRHTCIRRKTTMGWQETDMIASGMEIFCRWIRYQTWRHAEFRNLYFATSLFIIKYLFKSIILLKLYVKAWPSNMVYVNISVQTWNQTVQIGIILLIDLPVHNRQIWLAMKAMFILLPPNSQLWIHMAGYYYSGLRVLNEANDWNSLSLKFQCLSTFVKRVFVLSWEFKTASYIIRRQFLHK